MTAINNPKTWFILAFLAMLLMAMLLIVKHHNSHVDDQQRIYDHSEIIDRI
jgi:hypothetical protein